MQNALTRLEFPELFFGIASPIGVEIQTTIEALIEYLTKQSYDVVPIRVTDYFQTIKRAMSIDLDLYPNPTDARLDSYIAFGNRVREEFKDNSVLAAYAILQVTQNRDRTFRRRHTASYIKRELTFFTSLKEKKKSTY